MGEHLGAMGSPLEAYPNFAWHTDRQKVLRLDIRYNHLTNRLITLILITTTASFCNCYNTDFSVMGVSISGNTDSGIHPILHSCNLHLIHFIVSFDLRTQLYVLVLTATEYLIKYIFLVLKRALAKCKIENFSFQTRILQFLARNWMHRKPFDLLILETNYNFIN